MAETTALCYFKEAFVAVAWSSDGTRNTIEPCAAIGASPMPGYIGN
jgi:hypothetical protein